MERSEGPRSRYVLFASAFAAAFGWFAAVEAGLLWSIRTSRAPGDVPVLSLSTELALAAFYALALGPLLGLGVAYAASRFPRANGEAKLLALACLLGVLGSAQFAAPPDQRSLASLGLTFAFSLVLGARLWVAARGGTKPSRGWSTLLHPACASGLVLAPMLAAEPAAAGLWVRAGVAVSLVAAAALAAHLFTRSADTWAALATALALPLGMQLTEPRAAVQLRAQRNSAAPNIVLVTLDTTRADHMSLYGYERETTPHLEQLARESVVFERAFSASDLTLPSHASLFSGLSAREHGARGGHTGRWTGLAPQFETLAEKLSKSGYSSYAVVANQVISPLWGLDQGFEYFDCRRAAHFAGGARLGMPRGRLASFGAAAWPVPYRNALQIADETARVLEAARASQPFLLFVNFMDAHTPYVPPEPFASRFDGMDPKLRRGFTHRDYLRLQTQVLRGGELDPHLRAHLLSQYDAGIAAADEGLDRVVRQLRAANLLERTVLVVTADHGEAFGEHRTLNHGVSVHQEQVGVPLLFRVPGWRAARQARSAVGATDVHAALVALARGETDYESSPLAPINSHVVVAESYPQEFAPLNARFTVSWRAVVLGNDKLIAPEGRPPRYFDLARDPGELEPSATPRSERAALLSPLLQRWLAATHAGGGTPVRVDRETSAALEALGYLVEPEPPAANETPR